MHDLAIPPTALAIANNPTSENEVLALWLHGHAPLTIHADRKAAARFRSFIAKPLRFLTLGGLPAFANSLDGVPRTRVLATVKSLLFLRR